MKSAGFCGAQIKITVTNYIWLEAPTFRDVKTLFTEFENIISVKRYCKNRRAGFCNFDVDFLFNWIQYSQSDVSVTPVTF